MPRLSVRPRRLSGAAPPDPVPEVLDQVEAPEEELDPRLAEIVSLAREPLPPFDEDEVRTPASAFTGTELNLDELTASALTAINESHARTVEVIGALTRGRRRAEDKQLLATALDTLSELARREIPAPHVEVNVHPPEVTVNTPEVRPEFRIDVAAPEIPAARIDVHVPEQPAPVVNLHVPEQPAPVVNVAASAAPPVHVTVEAARPRPIRVETDADGTKRYVPEEPE